MLPENTEECLDKKLNQVVLWSQQVPSGQLDSLDDTIVSNFIAQRSIVQAQPGRENPFER